MMKSEIFTVPDYYPNFSCKMGACRHACCNGWPISISLKDYYRLVGEPCSADLRKRIDCSLHLQQNPTEEDYAFIAPNYFGDCPMLMEDGRCALHAELGENALSAVCRLYPRGVRGEGDLECSCANSCEAVIELFLKHPEPLNFIKVPLALEVPESRERSVYFETVGREQEIRLHFIRIMQQREVSLPARFVALGEVMRRMQDYLEAKDADCVNEVLTGGLPRLVEHYHAHSDAEYDKALQLAEKLLDLIDRHSKSIHDYGRAAIEYFGSGEKTVARYAKAKETLQTIVPNWNIAYEHMLVNHMFFERFPFQDRPDSICEEFEALCMIYIILRFLSLGWVALHPTEEAFTDVCAAAFRFFDHTPFDRYAISILEELGYAGSDDMLHLLML